MEYVWKFVDQNFVIFMKLLKLLLIIAVSFIIIKIGKGFIGRVFDKKSDKIRIDEQRTKTVRTIFESVYKYVIVFIAFVTILKSIFNIDATTIIATAGVGGIAIGFGAQNLVKDVITGTFILIEDQYKMGDIVTIGTFKGEVVEIGLRSTKLQNEAGDVFMIPNGQIITVINHSKNQKEPIELNKIKNRKG